MYHCTLFIEDTAILKGEIETDNNLKGPLSPDSLLTNVQRKIPNQYFNPPNSQFTETTQRKRDDGLKKETCRYSVGNESSLAQMPDSFAPLQRHRLWFDQFPRGAQRIALPPSKLLSPVSLSLSLSLSLSAWLPHLRQLQTNLAGSPQRRRRRRRTARNKKQRR